MPRLIADMDAADYLAWKVREEMICGGHVEPPSEKELSEKFRKIILERPLVTSPGPSELVERPNPETQAGAIWPAWHKLSEQKPMLDGIHDAVSSRKLCVVVQGDGRDEMCSLQVRSWNTAQGGSDRFDMGYAGYDEYHDAHVTDWCDLPTMPWYPPVQYRSPVEAVPVSVDIAPMFRSKLFQKFLSQGFWHAHHVDLVWRMDGKEVREEADWLKDLWYFVRGKP